MTVERRVGDVVDRYVLVRRLASTRASDLWRAKRDDATDPQHVVKFFHGVVGDRYQREERALLGMEHPNIVAPVDVGLSDDERYIVYPHVEGENLAERLARTGPLTRQEVAALGTAIASALTHAHERGILHADVKPDNILIPSSSPNPFSDARLIDFSVSSRLTDHKQTLGGEILGTPLYMAPEQLSGGSLSPATDVYGLGEVLFEASTGVPTTRASGLHEIAIAKLTAEVGAPTLDASWREFPTMVAACLRRDPSQRWTLPRVLEGLRAASLSDAKPLPIASGSPGMAVFGARPMVNAVGEAGPPQRSVGMPSVVAAASPPPHPGPTPSAVTVAGPAPRSASSWVPMIASAFFVVVIVGVFVVSIGPGPSRWQSDDALVVLLGVAVILVSLGIAAGFRMWVAGRREPVLEAQAQTVSARAARKKSLTESLAIEIGDLMQRVEGEIPRIRLLVVGNMLEQFQQASTMEDQQKALAFAMAELDKLSAEISPWYIRREKLITTVIAVIGCVMGTAASVVALANHATPPRASAPHATSTSEP